MHKSFLITEEDKNRILGMHENATKRQYLNEQTSNDACLVKLGGKKDEQGVYWVTNKEGKWGYYPDGRYHKEGSNNWAYYHCDGDKIVYKNKCVQGDCQNGKGTFILADGSKYTGDFKKGTAEGKGVFDYTMVKNIPVIGKMVKGKVKVFLSLMMVANIPVILKMVKWKVKGLIKTPMVMFGLVSSKMVVQLGLIGIH